MSWMKISSEKITKNAFAMEKWQEATQATIKILKASSHQELKL